MALTERLAAEVASLRGALRTLKMTTPIAKHPTRVFPQVISELAEKYGDPDDLLREDWIPQIPGITAAGSYDEYARNPGAWIYK